MGGEGQGALKKEDYFYHKKEIKEKKIRQKREEICIVVVNYLILVCDR